MLFQMAIILAIVGTVTEVMLVHKIKYVDKLYTQGSNLLWVKRWHIDGVVWNTIGSFGLSWIQGVMFGATGLVIALSGALGTGMSMLYFELEKWISKTYGHESVLLFIKTKWGELQAHVPQIKKSAADYWQLAKDVWKVIRFCLKVITFPLWGPRAASLKWNEFKSAHFTPTSS